MCLHRQRLFRLFLAVGLITAGTFAAQAQASRTINTIDRRIETMRRQARDFERDNMGRDPSRTSDAEAAKRRREIGLEIEEDLNALQSIYNDSVIALQKTSELKAGQASETGQAVRKHAQRLLSNLQLPEPELSEARPEPASLPETDRKGLSALCKIIYEFITNPMFNGSGALDVKNGSKARAELNAMIRLAEHFSGVPQSATR